MTRSLASATAIGGYTPVRGSLEGLRFQQPDLDEHAGEVVDATFVRDLSVAQPVDEDHGHVHGASRGRHAHEATGIGAGYTPDQHDAVAVDQQVVVDRPQIAEGQE